jgi:hypothetical protein
VKFWLCEQKHDIQLLYLPPWRHRLLYAWSGSQRTIPRDHRQLYAL